jgi:hypothetical protein
MAGWRFFMSQKYFPSIERIMSTFKVDKIQAELARKIMDGSLFHTNNPKNGGVSMAIEIAKCKMNFYETWKRINACYHRPSLHEIKMNLLDELLGSYGVEFINLEPGNYSWPKGIEYLNMGDTYTPTIIYYNNRYSIGCWGDYLEHWENRHGKLE